MVWGHSGLGKEQTGLKASRLTMTFTILNGKITHEFTKSDCNCSWHGTVPTPLLTRFQGPAALFISKSFTFEGVFSRLVSTGHNVHGEMHLPLLAYHF